MGARGRTIFAAFLLLAVPTMMVTFMVESLAAEAILKTNWMTSTPQKTPNWPFRTRRETIWTMMTVRS